MLNANTVAALLECVLALAVLAAIAGLGLALTRIAGMADRRAPTPHPAPAQLDAAASSANAPSLATRIAAHIHDRILADTWRREGRLSPAGYLRLCELMDRGLDVYPYMSGGELHGTAVVWDGTRGRGGERLTVEEWNVAAEHDTGAQDSANARGGAA